MIEVHEVRNILDSGERREFSSGAVRDISNDKGRMDLMPLDIVAKVCSEYGEAGENFVPFGPGLLFQCMDDYVWEGYEKSIYTLITSFIHYNYSDLYSALIDVSIHYQQGAQKYCERNWEKGIDAHSFVDSALRHGVKVLRGDIDEPHDRAFLWNLFGLLWIIHNKPQFNDLPYAKGLTREGRPSVSEADYD